MVLQDSGTEFYISDGFSSMLYKSILHHLQFKFIPNVINFLIFNIYVKMLKTFFLSIPDSPVQSGTHYNVLMLLSSSHWMSPCPGLSLHINTKPANNKLHSGSYHQKMYKITLPLLVSLLSTFVLNWS